MKIRIKTSEITFESENAFYFDTSRASQSFRESYINHLKELIQKVSEETIKIKNRNNPVT